MLMTPMTPKVMARPIAASSSTEPSDRPNQTFWPTPQKPAPLSMLGDRRAARPRRPRRLRRRRAAQQRERVAVAALGQHGDRRELARLLGGRIGDEHRAARASSITRRTPAPSPRRWPRRARRSPPGRGFLKIVCGRGEARRRVGRQQRQAAHRRADGAPQALLTRIASVELAPATSPSASPVSGSAMAMAVAAARPMTTDPGAAELADVALVAPSPSAASAAAAEGAPVAAIALDHRGSVGRNSCPSGRPRDPGRPRGRAASAKRRRRQSGRPRAIGASMRTSVGMRPCGTFVMMPKGSAPGRTRDAEGAAEPPLPVVRDHGRAVPAPPHLPVATLKFPQDIGARQSAIRSFESGR